MIGTAREGHSSAAETCYGSGKKGVGKNNRSGGLGTTAKMKGRLQGKGWAAGRLGRPSTAVSWWSKREVVAISAKFTWNVFFFCCRLDYQHVPCPMK